MTFSLVRHATPCMHARRARLIAFFLAEAAKQVIFYSSIPPFPMHSHTLQQERLRHHHHHHHYHHLLIASRTLQLGTIYNYQYISLIIIIMNNDHQQVVDYPCHDLFGKQGLYTGSIIILDNKDNDNNNDNNDNNDNDNDNNDNGIPDGIGTMIYEDGSAIVTRYTGHWENGHWHGDGDDGGECVLANGDVYKGSFHQSERHGRGEYTWNTTTTTSTSTSTTPPQTNSKQRQYVGMFHHNQRHGPGKYLWKTITTDKTNTTTTSSVSTYVGMFDNGLRQGHGVYTSPKVQYTGDWQAGKYHGYGVLEQLRGKVVYKGHFVQGKKHGRGMETSTSTTSTNDNHDGQPVVVVIRHDGLWQDDIPILEEEDRKEEAKEEEKATPTTFHSRITSEVWSTPQPMQYDHVTLSTSGQPPQVVVVVGMYKGIVQNGLPHGVGTMIYDNNNNNNNGNNDKKEYEGFWQDGIPHGYGRMKYINGDFYQGNFVKGQCSGRGEFTTASSSSSSSSSSSIVVYKGTFDKGKPHGDSIKALYPDQSYYDGTFDHHGQMTGPGRYVFFDGSSYKGNFIQGMFEGKFGELVTQTALYKGGFQQGLYHGQGTLTSLATNQLVYEGEWKEGEPADDAIPVIDPNMLEIPQPFYLVMNTNTTTTTTTTSKPARTTPKQQQPQNQQEPCKPVVDMAVTDGQDLPGHYTGLIHIASQRPHGVGRMVYEDGNRIHEGFWEMGHRQGHGRCLFVQIGDYHEGQYRQNLRHGPGKYLWKDGRQYLGNYSLDERSGEGKFWYSNGDVYQGQFLKGKRHGQGVFVFGGGGGGDGPENNKCTYRGEWSHGVYGGTGELQWKVSDSLTDETRIYKGGFQKGVFHGHGQEFSQQGDDAEPVLLRQGIWQTGKYQTPLEKEDNDTAVAKDIEAKELHPEKESSKQQQGKEQLQEETNSKDAISVTSQ